MSTTRQEKVVETAARLYEMRKFAHTVLGKRYANEVGVTQKILLVVMSEANIDLMPAALRLMTDAEYQEPMVQACIAAAVVDITEGINHTGLPLVAPLPADRGEGGGG